ncbi:MAG TPA: lactate racemase domain-containing protein [Bryobacteraceae bacterium]|nr:lactate racemase domain-containing protein [Bryobacteraceae bacterium]
MPLPSMVRVSQNFPHSALSDIPGAVRRDLASSGIADGLRPGARIAVGVGSRGISNLREVVSSAVDWLREQGANPFIFPAMGSHGGGTAEGQRKVIQGYGIDEAICPILSSVEVAPLGLSANGVDVYIDRTAAESDGILLVNRIKWHTTFEAPVESGLMKMAAIGIGKLYGAQEYHRRIVREGFYPVILDVAEHVLASGKILGGIGILENARHQTEQITAMRGADIAAQEPLLLDRVKQGMAKLPFPEIDILVVDEIGKHVSGVGMDSKVINRHPYGPQNPWSWLPFIRRVYARSVKGGNANGLGMADMISRRLLDGIDWESTRVNGLTANNLPGLRTPLVARDDAEALDILADSVGRASEEEVTLVRIRTTLDLEEFEVSENLLPHATRELRVLGAPTPLLSESATA